jgi:NAD(P)-dependent dehydrogenase (short-subunit alcohol dehydrogenase family)
MRLSGSVAIVTGAASDIGRAVGSALRREGATVVAGAGPPHEAIGAAVATHGRLDLAVVTATDDAVTWSDAAAPAIAAAGGGALVTIVTVRALRGDVRSREEAVAGAAVVANTRAIATELGKRGVRANTIAIPPPDIAPEVTRRSTLLPRPLHADDVASLAVFLASDDASFVTGQVLRCDGGLLAHLPHYAAMVAAGGTTTRR